MDDDRTSRLFELFDLADEGVEIRPFAGVEFGVEHFAIGADFEGAATGWDQGERRDAIAELEDLSRQTDGFWRVVSNRAKLDPDFACHRFPPFLKARLAGSEGGSRTGPGRGSLGCGVGGALARVRVEDALAQAER